MLTPIVNNYSDVTGLKSIRFFDHNRTLEYALANSSALFSLLEWGLSIKFNVHGNS